MCSGECAICALGDGNCLTAMYEDHYCPASRVQVERRLKNGEYSKYTDLMKAYLLKIEDKRSVPYAETCCCVDKKQTTECNTDYIIETLNEISKTIHEHETDPEKMFRYINALDSAKIRIKDYERILEETLDKYKQEVVNIEHDLATRSLQFKIAQQYNKYRTIEL